MNLYIRFAIANCEIYSDIPDSLHSISWFDFKRDDYYDDTEQDNSSFWLYTLWLNCSLNINRLCGCGQTKGYFSYYDRVQLYNIYTIALMNCIYTYRPIHIFTTEILHIFNKLSISLLHSHSLSEESHRIRYTVENSYFRIICIFDWTFDWLPIDIKQYIYRRVLSSFRGFLIRAAASSILTRAHPALLSYWNIEVAFQF